MFILNCAKSSGENLISFTSNTPLPVLTSSILKPLACSIESVPNLSITSCAYSVPALTPGAKSIVSLNTDLACGAVAESKESKNALNIYLAFAAWNNCLPFSVAYLPSAPINVLKLFRASGELDWNTSLSIVENNKSLGRASLPTIPNVPLFVNNVLSNFCNDLAAAGVVYIFNTLLNVALAS